MTALIASLLMGISALSTSIFAVVTQARDRERNVRKQEGDIQSIQSTIELDDKTRARLAAEAAKISSDVAIAQQTFWQEQFDAVKDELAEEQKMRRRLIRWASQHQEWDKRAWKLALETDPNYPPPPELEHD